MSQGTPPGQDPLSVNAMPPVSPQASPPSGKNGTSVIVIVLGLAFVMMLMCGGVLLALLLPAVQAARKAARTAVASNQVKQIGLGMHNYHSAYRQLPFTVTENTAGEERLGWRLALSPFVEGQSQWESYNNDVMWNSPVNEQVSIVAPEAFQVVNGTPGDTAIFVIVDPAGMFPPTPNTTIRFRDITDGLSNTLMAIQLPQQGVIWTSNINVTADEAFKAITMLQPSEKAILLMGDGAIRPVGYDFDRATFDALITIAGGEKIDPSF
ncbi:DUF1559 family PulG-like putative transporter [Rubripirellula reticaptiva]|uniref:DUF1559 domain-containing protein n=1 Tax=Rubripirellula reticaptiva TaxID=2528013 RepID=A0A5C6EKR1_9BACT|nr:DUF1559 domain-containing protein [Rubripirellula reticaptiva]TWU48186.1 hypothetical protein Poly59_50320 [Rubripirellula reticaptiva]